MRLQRQWMCFTLGIQPWAEIKDFATLLRNDLVQQILSIVGCADEAAMRLRDQTEAELLSAENDVGGMLGRLMLGDTVAERWQVDPGEHRFALAEHDRRQGDMQLVDQPGA